MSPNILYQSGEEDRYLNELKTLDDVELKRLLRSQQHEALVAEESLASAFAAAARTGSLLARDFDSDGYETLHTADDDSSFDDDEDDDLVSWTEDESSEEGYDADLIDDASSRTSGEDKNDGSVTEDGSDSTYTEDESSVIGSDGYSTNSNADESSMALIQLHALMKDILNHNATLCLVQFELNRRCGREYDGGSLVRAMIPWNFNLQEQGNVDNTLRVDSLSI